MRNMMLLAAAGAGILGMSTAASAAPITYKGSQQVGLILATYSITTDGTFGEIDTSHLTAFDVSLSEGAQAADSYSRTLNGGTGSWNGFVVASATSLTIAPFDSLSLYTNAQNQAGGFYGLLEFRSNGTIAQLTDTAYPNGLYQTSGAANGAVPFATAAATAAVPEPATWGLMILGLGTVGLAMRRRSIRVSFAA